MAIKNYGALATAAYPKQKEVMNVGAQASAKAKASSLTNGKALGDMSQQERWAYFDRLSETNGGKGVLTRVANNIISVYDQIRDLPQGNMFGIEAKERMALITASNFVGPDELKASIAKHRRGDSSELIADLAFATAGLVKEGFDINDLNKVAGKGETYNKVVSRIKQEGKGFYDRLVADRWRLTAGVVAAQIFDWLPNNLKHEFMQSKYFIEFKSFANGLESDKLDTYEMEHGETLQETRIREFLKEKGIDIPKEVLKASADAKKKYAKSKNETFVGIDDFFRSTNRANDPGANRF